MSLHLRRVLPPLALVVVSAISGCRSQPGETPPPPPPAPPPGAPLRQSASARTPSKFAGETKVLAQKQVEFLNKVRRSEKQFALVREARLNAQGEPIIILKGKKSWKEVQPLLKTVLTRTMQQFPGEDLTIVAYAPSSPPVKIGAARLDANTLQISYAPAAKPIKR